MTLVDQFFSIALNNYVNQNSLKEAPLFAQLREYTTKNTHFAGMLSGPVEGAFLQLLIKIANPLNCLEIGTFTGYSALNIGAALNEKAKLTCLETRKKYADIARSFFDKTNYGHKIEIILGDAKQNITNIQGPVDFVFCDADKPGYCEYYEEIIPKMPSGALFVADNALWGGTVTNPSDKDSLAIDKFNKLVSQDKRVENVLLTIRDGVMLARIK
jgi:caffeoyl-CoA O-methyltransferase